MVVKLLYTLIN